LSRFIRLFALPIHCKWSWEIADRADRQDSYIFSELAAGGDLYSFLKANGSVLDDLHTRIISRQIAIAVEYLHSQGVAHRDLKPENILVMRRGIGHRVVLTDFGCAGYTKANSGRMMTQVGTFDYVAP
jgi:serine/threonine protein kinase